MNVSEFFFNIFHVSQRESHAGLEKYMGTNDEFSLEYLVRIYSVFFLFIYFWMSG